MERWRWAGRRLVEERWIGMGMRERRLGIGRMGLLAALAGVGRLFGSVHR
jgi:hypothetical protein